MREILCPSLIWLFGAFSGALTASLSPDDSLATSA